MLIRLCLGALLILGVSGCATAQPKVTDQLQSRVTDLEKKLEEKDAEIVDLQYEVKDLSGKVSATAPASNASNTSEVSAPVTVKSSGSNDIIRVNVNPESVQTALKNAGVYNGKVDGKIGAGTKAAIVEFQKAHGLKADGVLGKKSWEELKTYLK